MQSTLQRFDPSTPIGRCKSNAIRPRADGRESCSFDDLGLAKFVSVCGRKFQRRPALFLSELKYFSG